MLISVVACSNNNESNETGALEDVASESLADKVGTVKFGTDGAYPPFNYVNDEGELVGLRLKCWRKYLNEQGLKLK